MDSAPSPETQSPLVLSAADVRRLLPMPACIDAMGEAMRATSLNTVKIPPRQFIPLMDGSGELGLMPGFAADPAVYGAKLVSLHGGNAQKGLPRIQGLVVLFDHDTGTPLVVMDGAEVTRIRTAAASGLATRALARANASTVGILGLGAQAVSHLQAMIAVRNIDHVSVWGRSKDKAAAFARLHSKRVGVRITPASQEVVCSCDIVCATTSASKPVLHGRWLAPGAHVNLVGTHTPDAREADSDAIAMSRVYVDLMSSAETEAGDILMAIKDGALALDDVIGEIGQLLTSEITGRTEASEITLYKSVGVVSQDLFAADLAYRAALQEQLSDA